MCALEGDCACRRNAWGVPKHVGFFWDKRDVRGRGSSSNRPGCSGQPGDTRQDHLIQVRSRGKADVASLAMLLHSPILDFIKLEGTSGPPKVTKPCKEWAKRGTDGLVVTDGTREQPHALAGPGDGDKDQGLSPGRRASLPGSSLSPPLAIIRLLL